MGKKAGQVAMEYALIIGVAALALAGLRLYFVRGIQSAVKIAADEMGDQDSSVAYDVNKGGLSDSKMRSVSSNITTTDSFKDGSRISSVNASSDVLPYGYNSENKPIHSSTIYVQSE